MARNAAGTWSVPVGQPVVAGTPIDPAAHNDLVTDIGTELTDSVSRSGKGGMLAAFKAADGAVGAPGVAFVSEPSSGIYRQTTGALGIAILGVARVGVSAAGLFADVLSPLAQSTSLALKGWAADGASAVGVVLDNAVTLANASAKLVSFKNNGTEKSYIDKDGNFSGGAIVSATTATAGTNWVATVNSLRRAGGAVSWNFAATPTVPAATWTAIATIPAGYRPATNIRVWARVRSTAAAKFYLAWATIGSDGSVIIENYDDGTSLAVMFTLASGDDITFHACWTL